MNFWNQDMPRHLWIEYGHSSINLCKVVRVRLIKNIIKYTTNTIEWEDTFSNEEEAKKIYNLILKLVLNEKA